MSKVGNILTHLLLIFLAILFLIPFYILFRNSLMTNPEITAFDWILFPKVPQWSNFAELFADPSCLCGPVCATRPSSPSRR